MRLSKITTKTGDAGLTTLADGTKIPKNATVFHAIGEVDELNCFVGSLRALSEDGIYSELKWVQDRLFDIGGELASGLELITEEDVTHAESLIEDLNKDLPNLKNFILPGGNEAAARAHICRAVTRRAERAYVDVYMSYEDTKTNRFSQKLLNRLSDYFFVFSRVVADGNEVLWSQKPKPADS